MEKILKHQFSFSCNTTVRDDSRYSTGIKDRYARVKPSKSQWENSKMFVLSRQYVMAFRIIKCHKIYNALGIRPAIPTNHFGSHASFQRVLVSSWLSEALIGKSLPLSFTSHHLAASLFSTHDCLTCA